MRYSTRNNANIIRTSLLLRISNELNRKNHKESEMKINSKTRDEMTAAYDCFEITIDNPVEVGKPSHFGKHEMFNHSLTSSQSLQNFTPSVQSDFSSFCPNIEEDFIQRIPQKKIVLSQLKLHNKIEQELQTFERNEPISPFNDLNLNGVSEKKQNEIREICDSRKAKIKKSTVKAFQFLYNIVQCIKNLNGVKKSKKKSKSPERRKMIKSFKKSQTLKPNQLLEIKKKETNLQEKRVMSPKKRNSFEQINKLFDENEKDRSNSPFKEKPKKKMNNIERKSSPNKSNSPYKKKPKACFSTKEIQYFINSDNKKRNIEDGDSDEIDEYKRNSLQEKIIKREKEKEKEKEKKNNYFKNSNIFRSNLHSSSLFDNIQEATSLHSSLKSKKYSDSNKIQNAIKGIKLLQKETL